MSARDQHCSIFEGLSHELRRKDRHVPRNVNSIPDISEACIGSLGGRDSLPCEQERACRTDSLIYSLLVWVLIRCFSVFFLFFLFHFFLLVACCRCRCRCRCLFVVHGPTGFVLMTLAWCLANLATASSFASSGWREGQTSGTSTKGPFCFFFSFLFLFCFLFYFLFFVFCSCLTLIHLLFVHLLLWLEVLVAAAHLGRLMCVWMCVCVCVCACVRVCVCVYVYVYTRSWQCVWKSDWVPL